MTRLEREKKTVEEMIRLYCKLNHKQKTICEECNYLLNYAGRKLSKCPFGDDKPACIDCSIHCYQKNEKEIIKQIMRYSCPKMLLWHPYLAIMHLLDKRKKHIPKIVT